MKCRRFKLLFSLVFMAVLGTGHATNNNHDFQKSDNSLTQNEVYDADINMDSQTQDNTLSEPPCKKRRLNVSAESDDLKDVFTSVAARFIYDALDIGDLEMERVPFGAKILSIR
eukprot:773015_1